MPLFNPVLLPSNNLNDVKSTSSSRTNLGLVTIASSGSASDLSAGTLAAARGGAGTINGALKANGSGAVSLASSTALSDMANNVISGSWTPTDGSGASLVFTGVAATYTRIGNMVFASVSLGYPSTADSSSAVIAGLPIATGTAGRQGYVSYCGVTTLRYALPAPGGTTISLLNSAGAAITNATMSGNLVVIQCIYSAT